MIYYKGYIVNNEYLIDNRCSEIIGYSYGMVYDYNSINLYTCLSNIGRKLEINLQRTIGDAVKANKTRVKIDDKDLIKYFDNLFLNQKKDRLDRLNDKAKESFSSVYILYELVKDNNGNIFGKEIYTGLVFPIVFPILSNKVIKYNYELVYSSEYNYSLEIIPFLDISSMLKCERFIINHQIANDKDLEEYFAKHNYADKFSLFKINRNGEKKRFSNKITQLAKENVFSEDFQLKKKDEKKVLEHQSNETLLMEEIEYNLLKLKSIDENKYIELKTKYDSLLSSEFTKISLVLLSGEIECILLLKKRNVEDILEFIEGLKKEYLNGLINNENKTEIDLSKIDKITELFLRIKDKYDYKCQRQVLNNLAFLYLMEVYENKDTTSIVELENSYFKDYLKSIVMWINVLKENGIIECKYLISLRDELSVKVVFDLINNITFRNNKDVKDKILRI